MPPLPSPHSEKPRSLAGMDKVTGSGLGPCLHPHPCHILTVGAMDFPPLDLGHGRVTCFSQWMRGEALESEGRLPSRGLPVPLEPLAAGP